MKQQQQSFLRRLLSFSNFYGKIKNQFLLNGGFKSKLNLFYILVLFYGLYILAKEYGLLPKKSIKGNHIFITGAGSGLGRLVAIRLAKLGAKLTLSDLTLASVQQTQRMIKAQVNEKAASESNVILFELDVCNRKQLQEVAKACVQALGPVDILMNNAGVVQGGVLAHELNETLASKTMVVNAESHFWTVKEFLPSMIQRNSGHIVSIASMAGLCSTAGMADYNASKFAAVGFNEAVRIEMKYLGKNIKCTTICPCYIDTGMFNGVKTTFPYYIMNQLTVADRIVTAILQEEGEVAIPWSLGTLCHLGKALLTSEMCDYVEWIVMGWDSMLNNFKGRGLGQNAPIIKTLKTSTQALE